GRRLYERDVTEARRLLTEAGFPTGLKTPVEATLTWSPDYVDELQVTMRSWKDAGIDAELKGKDFGAYMATTVYGKFDKLAHGLRGGSPIADISLYNAHVPGEAFNASGVDDPKLTEMIRLQRRTPDGADGDPRDEDADAERGDDEQHAQPDPQRAEPERADLPAEVRLEPRAAHLAPLRVIDDDGDDGGPAEEEGAHDGDGGDDADEEADGVQAVDDVRQPDQ